jgi:pimeloyl-ACP methyl ester carboxylesterase
MSLLHRRPLSVLGALVVLVALIGTLITASDPRATATPAPAADHHQARTKTPLRAARPTIVLVHGAWADSSGWAAELKALRAKGYDAIAVANPLRGLSSDTAYVRSVLDTIEGPVVLVGHSYGGAVISGAAAGATNVRALVYVAAFMPDEGEPVGLLTQLNPGSLVTEEALEIRPYPLPDGGTGVDLYLRPGVFRQAFAGDLPRQTTLQMWATQRPLAASAFSEPAGPAAWRTIPSWYLLATQDNTIPPATQAYMAERAHARITRVRASHVAMQSRPGATTELILTAARAVQ